MTDDVQPAPARDAPPGVYAAIENLRSDVREDIGHLRDDVREDIAASEGRIMATLTDYVRVHRDDHNTQRDASQTAHRRFEAFIDDMQLAQARRDGALGVFRFGLELVSRHWRPLTAVLFGLTGLVIALTGSIHIEVVAR